MPETPFLTPEESSYPLPSEASILEVTPEMASDWSMARKWPHQRRTSQSVVGKYLKDMQEGRWKLTRQGLVFDTQGYNIDGRHRLRAVANMQREQIKEVYGTDGIPFWVYPDEPTETFDSYDQNFRRIAAHLIHEPNAVVIAAAGRFLASVADNDPWSFPRFSRMTTAEVLQTRREWPELSRLVAPVVLVKNKVRINAPAHLTVLAQAARTEYGTPENFREWFDVLQHGATGNPNDPRLKLRDRFLAQGPTLNAAANRPQTYGMIVKAWNAFVEKKDIPVLFWRQNERIPQVIGFDWSNPAGTKETAE